MTHNMAVNRTPKSAPALRGKLYAAPVAVVVM